ELEARLVDRRLVEGGRLGELQGVLRALRVVGAGRQVKVADAHVLPRTPLVGVAPDERVRRVDLIVEARAEGRPPIGREDGRVKGDGVETRVEHDRAHY